MTVLAENNVTYRSVAQPHQRRDHGWRYFAVHMDGEGGYEMADGDVPLRGASITDVLSGPLVLSGTLEPENARFVDNAGRPIFKPWKTAIFAERDGHIYGGGLLLPSSFQESAWSIECAGFTGYWANQPFTDSEFLVEVDPIDVMRRIWEWMQEQPGANLGLEIDDTKSGQKIGVELDQIEYDTENGPLAFEAGPVKLNWYDTHDLGGMVDEYAKNTPCDYHEVHWWDGDTLRHRVDIGYPRLGRRRRSLRFVIGENIAVIPSVEAGQDNQYATHVLGLGAGEGRTMKMALKAKTRFDGLRRVAIVEDPRMNTVAKVNKFAQRELDKLKGLASVREVVVRNSENAKHGDWQVGDEILVQGDAGWQQLETWCRIVSSTISPEDSDNSVLTVVSQGQEVDEQ